MARSSRPATWRKEQHQSMVAVPNFPFPNPSLPALFSGLAQTVCQNVMSAFQSLKNPRVEVLESLNFVVAQRPLVLPFLSVNSVSPSPTASASSSPRKVLSARSRVSSKEPSSEGGEVSSTGPAFIGQVFTMCDSSRRGLIGVRPVDAFKSLKLPPYLPSFLTKMSSEWLGKATNFFFKEDMRGPVFRFYFDKDEAAAYVKGLNLSGSVMGSCPLDAAYKYVKGKPPMFKFMPDQMQVHMAKQLLRKDRGGKAAKKFKGVPVFTARNLTIAMSTPNGVRWFTPYFFDKRQLDSLIGHSVDHYYQMLIQARRSQRHNQVIDNNSSELPGDVIDDEPDGLLDPPEVQELMEEMGQGGGGMEWVVVKACEVQVQDMVDRVLLGHPWSRRLAGLQPKFPVLVDSFERRAAAAELEVIEEGKNRLAKTEVMTDSEDNERPRSSGGEEVGSTSGSDGVEMGHGDVNGRTQNSRVAKERFNLFGSNTNIGFKRKDLGDAASLEEDSDFEGGEPRQKEEQEGMERLQPKLTMMGIAMNGPVNGNDAVLQRAMAAAAKDIEDRVRKGEGSGQEHGPLFIADLGAPPEVWGREASSFPGWESDETD